MKSQEGQFIEFNYGSEQTIISGTWEMIISSEFVYWNQNEFHIHGLVVQAQAYFKINEAKLLIHPEDIPAVLRECEELTRKVNVRSYFRIINSIGVFKIICLEAVEERVEGKKKYLCKLTEEDIYISTINLTETDTFALVINVNGEQFLQTGTWQINLITHQTMYSPNIYRLHGVIPGSLQPHPDTFKKYIHPEDKQIVIKAQDKALIEYIPLHLEYRIITEKGEIRYVKQTSRIIRNEKAEKLMLSIMQDITESKQIEITVNEVREQIAFQNNLIQYLERTTQTGYLQLNVHTRKIIYSENFYRIHGLKPQNIHPVYEQFLNYTYPEDRILVSESIRAALEQHLPPQIQYRIFRADGKLRWVQLTGKIITNADKEQLIVGIIKDVTEEDQLAKDLHQVKEEGVVLQESVKLLEEWAGIGSWQGNLQTGQLSISGNFYRIHGLRPQTVHDGFQKFEEFIHWEDRKLIKPLLIKVFTEKLAAPVKFRIVTIDGQLRYVQIENSILRSGAGRQILQGTIRDITKEELLRYELQTQTGFIKVLSDSMMDKYLVTDVNHNILFLNKGLEEQYKIKNEDVTGRNLFDTLPSMKHPDVIKHLEEVLADQAVQVPKLHCLVSNEFLIIYSVPVKDPEHKITGVLSIAHDITPELILKEQLTKRLHVIENLVENTIDRIIVLDENLNFLIWNKKCEEHYQISKEQVIRKNVLEIFPTFKKDKAYENCKLALSGQSIYVAADETTIDTGYFEQYVVPLRDEKEKVYAVLWIVHDLTKEYHLTREHRKAHDILDAINEGCFELDAETHCFRYFNAKAREMLVHPHGELMGKCIWDVFPQTRNSQLYEAVIQVGKSYTTFQKEYFSELLDKWIFLNVTPSEGGIVVLILDVQAKKDAEVKVQQTYEQWRALVENTSDLITRWNKDLRLLYANPAFELKTGKPVASMLNKTNREIGQPKDLALLYAKALKDAYESGLQKDYFNHILPQDGLDYFHTRIIPEFAADGSVQSILAIARDITCLKNTEDALKESQRFTEILSSVIPDIIYLYDLTENKIIYSNNSWVNFIGFHSREEGFFQSSFNTLIHPDDLSEVITHLENMKVRSDGEVSEIRYRIINDKKQVRWIWDRGTVFTRKPDGTAAQKLGIFRDITDITLAQQPIGRIESDV